MPFYFNTKFIMRVSVINTPDNTVPCYLLIHYAPKLFESCVLISASFMVEIDAECMAFH